jgi:cysteine desulfurase/selenocysteine lyase
MAARGIPPGDARKLLVRAFIADASSRSTTRASSEALLSAALDALGRRGMSTLRPSIAADLKADFPGLRNADGSPWHYLDSAATAQKPQAVIERGEQGDRRRLRHRPPRGLHPLGRDDARLRAARRRVAAFVGGREDEIVFNRGATEAINLVATAARQGPRAASELEHHSKHRPLAARRLAGRRLPAHARRPDRSRCRRTDADHGPRDWSPSRTSRTCSARCSTRDAPLELAHAVGAMLLLDGCQAVPRLPVDVAALGLRFLRVLGHKLYGPTGIGALWAKAELLAAMPPWQGGGGDDRRSRSSRPHSASGPQRFEAGTPAIVEAIGFGVACDYVASIGLEAIHPPRSAAGRPTARRAARHETTCGCSDRRQRRASSASRSRAFTRTISAPYWTRRTSRSAPATTARRPLMERLGVPATARASFGLYSDEADVAALLRGIERTKRIFG